MHARMLSLFSNPSLCPYIIAHLGYRVRWLIAKIKFRLRGDIQASGKYSELAEMYFDLVEISNNAELYSDLAEISSTRGY